jgi:hypothetical protein
VKGGLAITLRFPATGDSYYSVMYLLKVSKQSVSLIIPHACAELTNAVDVMYATLEKWSNLAY